MAKQWMIYGANGYSAKLAAIKASQAGLKPILAGRNKVAVEALAKNLGLEARVFDLDEHECVVENLKDITVVSHCAGPFSATAKSMMLGCIEASCHYTDITGEMEVFDLGQSLDQKAKEKGVVLCSGVGFDVIPTDCLAHKLKAAMPDAEYLTLAFSGSNQVSPGTAKTVIEGAADGMKIRRSGQVVTVGRAYEMRDIDYGKGKQRSVIIPWGDISTAYWQTKIPNISVYTPYGGSVLLLHLFPIVQALLKLLPVQWLIKKVITRTVKGPSNTQLNESIPTFVWGEVTNKAGKKIEGRVKVPNGYTVTIDGILATSKFFMEYEGEGGCFTPAQIMGSELVEQLPGATEIELFT